MRGGPLSCATGEGPTKTESATKRTRATASLLSMTGLDVVCYQNPAGPARQFWRYPGISTKFLGLRIAKTRGQRRDLALAKFFTGFSHGAQNGGPVVQVRGENLRYHAAGQFWRQAIQGDRRIAHLIGQARPV